MDLNPYLRAKYQEGGRGDGVFDCWGLVRQVLYKEFKTPLFASYGHVQPEDKISMTRHGQHIRRWFIPCVKLEAGVVVLAYQKTLMVHVGVCVEADGLLKILHAHRLGIRLESLRNFERHCDGNRIELVKVPT